MTLFTNSPILATPSNMWDKGFNSLDHNLRTVLEATKTYKRDIVGAALKEVENKREQSARRRWKFKNTNGEVVVVRDMLEKIAGWLNRFKERSDITVQTPLDHSRHTWLPWAPIRFLLQAVVIDFELFGAVIKDLEVVSRLVTLSRYIEHQYLRKAKSEPESLLDEALSLLCVDILAYLARIVEIFKNKDIVRRLKNTFRTVSIEHMPRILAREDEVLKIARLTDTEALLLLDATVTRISAPKTLSSRSVSNDKYADVLDWLSGSPYYSHHEFVSQSRLTGAGKWLAKHPDYMEWHNTSSSSLLLLHGIPGCGKTTLCSVVVDALLTTAANNPSAAPFGYFYCANTQSEKTRASSDNVMRTLLGQLALSPTEPRKIQELLCSEYDRQSALARIDGLDLPKLHTRDCTRLILDLAEKDPLTIVIDSVDSMDEEDQIVFLSSLRHIVAKSDNVVKIFITSRSNIHILSGANNQVQITAHETRMDMKTYIRHQVHTSVADKLLLEGNASPSLQITEASFLWVKLQIEQLCREKEEANVVTALQNELPEDLDQLYAGALSHIFKSGVLARDIAVTVFLWLIHMQEPPTPSALLSALSITDKSTNIQLPQLLSICANLVVLDSRCNVLRFCHQTVQEFLELHEVSSAANAHCLLTSACIEACSEDPVPDINVQTPSEDFHAYAALYWPVHFKMAQYLGSNGYLIEMVYSFIFEDSTDTTQFYRAWTKRIRDLVPKLPESYTMRLALDAIPESNNGPVFMASMFGLDGVLDKIMSKLPNLDINGRDQLGQTPVYLAAAFGYAETVTTLVRKGAKVNVECGKYGSPLHAACFHGHVHAADELLKLGASTSCGTVFGGALQAAIHGGKEDVALLLIEHGSAITAQEDYDSAVEGAAQAGFSDVLNRLQHSKFFAWIGDNSEHMRNNTRKAIEGGHVCVLHQLLDQQAGNVKEYLPPDAVALAALYNHKDMVELLLDLGMEIDRQGTFGTPLRTACLLNCVSIVRLILARGADINDHCGLMGDALQIAAAKDHTSIVKLLVEEGVSLNQETGFHGTALQAAAFLGQRGAVETLLDAGADVNAEGISRDALHAAAEGGHPDIIVMMLRKGFRFRIPRPSPYMHFDTPSRYKSVLRDASPSRHNHSGRSTSPPIRKAPIIDLEEIFRVAIGNFPEGQIVMENSTAHRPTYRPRQSQLHYYPLTAGASSGHEGVVKLLLERREVLGIRERDIKSSIEYATKNGHIAVVEALLDGIANGQRTIPYITAIADMGQKSKQAHLVEYALYLASKYCSEDELVFLRKSLTTWRDAERYRTSEVSKYMMLLHFAEACQYGKVHLITAILDSGQHIQLSSEEIQEGLQLCAIHGQRDVTQILLECQSLKDRMVDTVEAFVVASASGQLIVVKLLADHRPEYRTSVAQAAIQRALVVSSGNGHIEVVQYLVEELHADVNISAPDLPGAVRRWPSSRKVFELMVTSGDIPWEESSEMQEALAGELSDDDWEDERSNGSQGQAPRYLWSTTPRKTQTISALQASIRGFAAEFYPSIHRHRYPLPDHTPLQAGQSQKEEVIIALLGFGANPNDSGGQDRYPIQLVTKYCPERVVQRFILAGADVNATKNDDSALQEAAGRELSAVTIMHWLFDAGASIPVESSQSDQLLANALGYFEGDMSRVLFLDVDKDPDGHFLVAPSLEYIFQEGPAAVLYTLLSRMPQKETTDTRYGLVLQMAALLDNEQYVDLLLSRGTNVNAKGYYYGTALQAAARFGHETMVQKLIKAGADVNILQGQWQTALRAALVDGHEDVAQILLTHGADVNLRLTKQRLHKNDSVEASETALQMAVKSGKLSIVQTLLARGANIDDDAPNTVHPLIQSAKQGNAAIVRVLLDAGVSVNTLGKKRQPYWKLLDDEASPLHAASMNGHLNVVKELLTQGADIESNPEAIGTPLDLAAAGGQHQALQLLILAGANIKDSTALSNAARRGYTGIVKELLAAGEDMDKVNKTFPLACRVGKLDLIEVLLEKVYAGSDPEFVVQEVFDMPIREVVEVRVLHGSVVRLLLDYAPVTKKRFHKACAAGLVDTMELVLDQEAADINGEDEHSGDYPLQVAASHLQPDMSESLRARETVERLSFPKSPNPSPIYIHYDNYYVENPSSFLHLTRSEAVVQHLVSYGADIKDQSRTLGPPLHFACLLGSKVMVELFLDKGAGINETAGYFEKAIFAALEGRNPHIVELLLERAPPTDHFHPDYATPLHFACSIGDGASTRKLLEHGADATVMNSKGETPLTLALRNEYTASLRETPLGAIIKVAKAVHILEDDDLAIAANVGKYCDTQRLGSLLELDKDIVVSEKQICKVLRGSPEDKNIIHAMVQRSGGIGVTVDILKAARDCSTIEVLLEHGLLCKITPDLLQLMNDRKSMKLLLDRDSEVPVTHAVVLHALKLDPQLRSNDSEQAVLEVLFERDPYIPVTHDMLEAVRCAADMEILLKRLEPGTPISNDVVLAVVSALPRSETFRMMRLLLDFDTNIELSLEVSHMVIKIPDALDALEMLLDHNPSMPVTPKIFLRVFEKFPHARESTRESLADLMIKYGKRVVFTDKVRTAIDESYANHSDVEKKELFYSLQNIDENELDILDKESEDEF
ncbi:hypothetical protein VMCG_04769 [Cytospora schulzeri]|uniref:AAA+ ATPase domain-containing protein n=1 Tax=Cytospora schulzeri TaxID=448051 RepID=A0A423WN09_9PEZI|nr:hypothetical protein VMCG_04769 [Valsa malicola]